MYCLTGKPAENWAESLGIDPGKSKQVTVNKRLIYKLFERFW